MQEKMNENSDLPEGTIGRGRLRQGLGHRSSNPLIYTASMPLSLSFAGLEIENYRSTLSVKRALLQEICRLREQQDALLLRKIRLSHSS
jgi:hypothetical protein